MAEPAYYEDDYDNQWPDYDACYYEDTENLNADEQDTEGFDIEEYDNIFANFVEARSKLNQMRVNRGFYPVVALVDQNGMKGSGKSKSKGKGKSKGKSKGRGSSPSQKGSFGTAKSRGKAAMSSEVDVKFVFVVELQGIKHGIAHHRAIASAKLMRQVTT